MSTTDTLTETIAGAETAFFDGLTAIHEQVVEANQFTAERVAEFQASIPAVPGLESLPTFPTVEIPSATDAVARYYDFAGKVLDANRSLAEKVAAAWAPVLTTETAAPAPAAKKAAPRSTKK